MAGHLLLRARRAAHALGLRHRPPIDLAPLLGLRLRTPRLELRLPDEGELVALAHVAERGVHPPGEMPFLVPWTDAIGTPGFVDGFVAYHCEQREAWKPEAWHLLLGVWAGGELAGIQAVEAKDFAASRVVQTGSWLGQSFQGRGHGTEMRAAVLELAFRGLGAEAALSGAIAGNVASARVSEKLGYERDGTAVAAPRGERVCEQRFRLERARWHAPIDVELEGLDPCLALFGL